MDDKRKFITVDQAISLLNEGDQIHTFRNPAGMLVGCDWDRVELIATIISNPDSLEIGGDACRGMDHGLILKDDTGYLFIECSEDRINELDPIVK